MTKTEELTPDIEWVTDRKSRGPQEAVGNKLQVADFFLPFSVVETGSA